MTLCTKYIQHKGLLYYYFVAAPAINVRTQQREIRVL